ncbi:DMT family transporter [Avibacterium paragallinarum]|uniref:DMT family transporter n=1 Tax=Avibacterium paragallinarum TaxID=728 RepID=A0AAE5WHH7_AVIPA|nr:DMT family transporter [Avibacterium paragallinarum]MEE3608109.1 DMT family transporter [Avibacterium paragallinarum]MEE3621042.1 DMT family transporter [Avibacterium paragallinarum]MEE3668790.1 DMT family transporter [Avibacterium paragallinarum]MEE3680490.1 DMT family transporter [Avibacterium paragallinarum]MEE4385656.1 DMT family transporter [Avibacterium paragallinarum]
MHYLFLAILCSVAVSVLLKTARRFNVAIEQSIAFNYVVALLLSYFLLIPNFQGLSFTDFIIQNENSGIFLALGLLLPGIFLIMSKAVELTGIVRADAAQRLSLFLPILSAFILFDETLNLARVISLILAFSALFCLIKKPRGQNQLSIKGGLSLLSVWLGYGMIDILFKQTAKMGNAFPTTLFIAFTIAMCVMFVFLLIKRTQWHLSSLLAGIILGSLNFMNILFYIRAHQFFNQNPTFVFAGMNIGVICLGAIIGVVIFKEKISKINGVGIVLGILAILSLFYLEPFLAR